MRVSNDEASEQGPFEEFVRLQADFQARLADETMRYLRRLQATAGPAMPGTVVVPDPDGRLDASIEAGGTADFDLEIENLQGVHCIVTPTVSAFVHDSGAVWYPAADVAPSTVVVAPSEVASLRISIPAPQELPAGRWQGSVVLHGFRGTGLAASITVAEVGDDTDPEAADPEKSTSGPSENGS